MEAIYLERTVNLQEYVKSLKSGPLDQLLSKAAAEPVVACSGVSGSLRAVLAARLYMDQGRSVVWVVHKPSDLDRAETDARAIAGEDAVHLFPPYDTIPYEPRKPHARVIEERLRTLNALSDNKPVLVVVALQTLLFRVVPPAIFVRNTLDIKTGEEMELSMLVEWVAGLGYERVPIIEDMGQFCVRGGIFDFFPPSSDFPVRVEFLGDTIDSIRLFDIFTQRSVEKKEGVRILPMRELLPPPPKTGEVPAERGLEWRLPEVTSDEASLLDYLRPRAVVLFDETPGLDDAWQDNLDLLTAARRSDEDPLPEKLLVNRTLFRMALGRHGQVRVEPFRSDATLHFDSTPQPVWNRQGFGFFQEFRALALQGFKITVACENAGQEKRFRELAHDAEAEVDTVLGNLDEGFVLNGEKIALFSENRLFNRYAHRARFRRYKGGTTLHHVSSLKAGDIVVHADHGIGRFLGLERIKVGLLEKDCIRIEYADKAMLSVPVEDLDKVQKYSAVEDETAPPLSALGGKVWEKTKAKAKAELNKIVHGLVDLYAQRKHFPGIAYPEDSAWQAEFEDSFIYEDTPDQRRSSEEVKADLRRDTPMDRLVCGDAGFGKTEVAMRAAFKVVEAGRQVAVLVPTTLLAMQHYQSFRERFGDYPVHIGMVCRFVPRDEALDALKKLQAGDLDILIGTHRLLSKDVKFKELGLLVIDEEHKFGVRHKEKLKEFRAEVDVLSLTATPIPRTLQFSLLGVRDMSVITTPPRNRLPVQTRVAEEENAVIREAVLREKARGGQVFFIHNRVQTIGAAADELRRLLPGVTFGVAHGQMGEDEIEEVMLAFVERKTDVLICSTIIESGIDIPNANTLVVRDADHFGLSQLYQLRGRIGRSSVQAYAFLLVRSLKGLTDDSRRRLKALEQLTEFGAGFQVAMRDLEIRGAGNLLGLRQHGLMCQVGFEMYNTLLNEAVQEIRENRKVTRTDPRVRLETRAFLPAEYVPESAQRIEIYHRLSRAESLEAIEDMRIELADRFGPPPESAAALIDVLAIRFCASRILAASVTIDPGRMTLEFGADPGPSTDELGALIRKLPPAVTVRYGTPMALTVPLPGPGAVAEAKKLLRTLL